MEGSNTDKVVCKCGAVIPSRNIMIRKTIDMAEMFDEEIKAKINDYKKLIKKTPAGEGDEVIYVSTKCVKCWTEHKASFYGVLSLEEYENGTDLAIIRKAKQALQPEIDKKSFINMCNCGVRIYEHLIEYSHPSIFEKDIAVIKDKCSNCGAVHSTSKRIDIEKMKANEIKEMLKEALQDKIYGKE